MHLIFIPPGARAEPHVHVGFETGIYVLEGTVCTRWGPQLEHEVVSRAGEFLFVPPGVPHEVINLSATEPARAFVARNDPAQEDKVQPFVRGQGAAQLKRSGHSLDRTRGISLGNVVGVAMISSRCPRWKL
jgi:uncharacterized RmlC-like cupin family protein